MEFRVLGPVGIWRDERFVSIVGQKQRTLLAVLVLNANRVVSHDRLLVALWGSAVPASGRRLLHNHLWSLRRLLGDIAALASSPAGYALQLPAGSSDLDVFDTKVEQARTALSAGDAAQAAERFREALSLWRGPALAGTHPEFQLTEGPGLEERRVVTLTERIDVDLALGGNSELIAELRRFVAENPLHEKFRGQLMLALYREGRAAEALEEYRIVHRHFRNELGLEPGEDLARLHQAILSADPSLDPEPRRLEVPVAPRSLPIPRQLPSDIARFTGRKDDLRQLDLMLSTGKGGVPAMVITSIAGTAGIGKTALATHWGHRVAGLFPDGQLYVNLRGYSQGQPVAAAQALHRLLRGLGVAVEEIPQEVDERETLYRSLLADRRVLVVLDNAASPDQVRPLLPGSPSCKVIITSRDSLRGLWVTHDVRGMTLDVLSADEARDLLVAILGTERVRGEAEALSQLARLCGHLPLALRLAAAHLTGQPSLSVDDMVARLRDENPLVALDIGEDPHSGVRAAFELSYRALPETARRVFRLMGFHPGPDIGVDAVLVLAGLPSSEGRAAIDRLVAAHLIQRGEGGRLAMHDLVRVYARDRGDQHDPATDRRDALSRLFEWYLHTADEAMNSIDPGRLTMLHDVSPEARIGKKFTQSNDASEWLEAEYQSLVAVIGHCSSYGWPVHAWKMARTLSRFFYFQDRIEDWLVSHEQALTAARELGDRRAEAEVLGSLAYANVFAGNHEEYLNLQWRVLELCQAAGNRKGEAKALCDVGYGLLRIGRLPQAIEACLRSLEVEKATGARPSATGGLYRLAIAYKQVGRLEEALDCLRECLLHVREKGDRRNENEGYILIHLGEVQNGLGHTEDALRSHLEAFGIGRQAGNSRLEADALNNLGRGYRRQGRYLEAVEHHEKALMRARELRNRELECDVLIALGRTFLAMGEHDDALDNHQAALKLSVDIKYVYFEGHAHKGLAEALDGLGREEEARVHRKEALTLFARMGIPQIAVIERSAVL
ncbi:BTAD domain-containing putative transcriptional regulator [Streptosporangium amethystogenes subsp. fukuiense]|uniref:BTAD domain-containing putative transcriptional regulator n=1 Tax=Streptosporangium amethystogenes subsp. fukuiense TaxID=698418 RepID=A0ABW2T053_9ACTN